MTSSASKEVQAQSKRSMAIELFILSAVSLFLELLVIRWMSADIRAFTVFRTFPLITCFVGLGVGFSLNRSDSYKLLPFAIFLFAITMKIADFMGFGLWSFPSISVFQWQNLTGLVNANNEYVMMFLLCIIIILGIPFGMCVAIASRMGVLFNELESLPAYCYNILGSLVGGIVLSLLSNTRMAPWQLLIVAMGVIVAMQWKNWRRTAIGGITFSIVIAAAFTYLPTFPAKLLIPELTTYHASERQTLWSPYQRIDLTVLKTKEGATKDGAASAVTADDAKAEVSDFVGLELSANRAFYQYFFNLKANSPLSKQELWKNIRDDYALAFNLNKPKSALIVGSGTGQNVTSALDAGVGEIDAVEIDPVILEIGKKYNPDNLSDKVHLICDDARHFFSQCKRKYDVVNFSTLDSHTIAGLGSSVRIDAYVYTKESIKQALGLLNDDGVLLISFATVAPWSEARLFQTFTAAAGYEPIVLKGKMIGCIFVLGPHVKDRTLPIPAEYPVQKKTYPAGSRTLTDDWPYLYVQPEKVDYPYLLVVLEVLALSLYAGRRLLFGKSDGHSWQMFFLGSAFMLLELHSISFLSLLYGSTWITSAFVINGILLMILAATIATNNLGQVIDSKIKIVYAILFAAILTSFLISQEGVVSALASGGQFIQYSLVTVLTILPMGIAAVVFASGLRASSNTSKALAFNLFGAVVGGLLEYLSTYLGIRNLLLVAASLYLCSMVSFLTAAGKSSEASGENPTQAE